MTQHLHDSEVYIKFNVEFKVIIFSDASMYMYNFFMHGGRWVPDHFFLMHSQNEKKFNSCCKTWNLFDFIIIQLAFIPEQRKKKT